MSAAALAADEAKLNEDIRALEAELAEIDSQSAELVMTDPGQVAAAHVRRPEIETSLSTKRRTLALISAGVAVARDKERLRALSEEKETQRKSTEKLANSLEKRWNAATAPLVALLRELDQDAEACRQLNKALAEAGIPGINDAEETARGAYRLARPWDWTSLGDAKIAAFAGGDLWSADRGTSDR